jgi:hypothetical protein
LGVRTIHGIWHDHYCGNYRNYIIGLQELYNVYPDADWFCWMEYDVLIASSWFKMDLEHDYWMIGCDLRNYPCEFPLLSDILGMPIKESRYLLGCLHFLHRDFVTTLVKMGFFNKMLEATNTFEHGHFPGYERYAFEEEMLPAIAFSLGGSLMELSCWLDGSWRRTQMYPVRFEPDIMAIELSP